MSEVAERQELVEAPASAGPGLDRLREVLGYDPNTGLFRWNEPSKYHPDLTSKVAGSISGGYVVIKIDGKAYKAHRLAWLYVNEEWPAGDIDHKNGCPLDNRITNLRLATNAQNQANKVRQAGKPMPKGVRQLPSGSYNARIKASSGAINLGVYRSQDEAAMAYAFAALHHYSEFSRSA